MWFDSEIKRSRIAHADSTTLAYVPPWYGNRMLALGEQGAARIGIGPPVDPAALHGLDPGRAGLDRLPMLKEISTVVSERTTNWTAVACPIPAWAGLVHPELDEADALSRLWEEVAHVSRLDEADPAAAWRDRMAQLDGVAGRLSEQNLDAARFEGPGTALTVGLLPSPRWLSAMFSRKDGLPHLVNLPSEEVFTTPDPLRADGVVCSTRPLALGGLVVEGLRVRFEGGRAVQIDADAGAEALRAQAETDKGAGLLGEVALVDRDSRIGRLGTTFYDTLPDENAASHVAPGSP